MQRYLIGFFNWWYLIQGMEILNYMLGRIMFILEYTNTLPMARNLFLPLYQDNSRIGRIMGFAIRSIWVAVGGFLSFLISIPVVMMIGIYLILPFFTIFRIVTSLLA